MKTHIHNVPTYWFHFKINGHCTSNGIGNTKRWRGQVVGTCVRIDATLKVSVSTKNTNSYQVSFLNCTDHLIWKRPTVSNACHTAIAHQVESGHM